MLKGLLYRGGTEHRVQFDCKHTKRTHHSASKCGKSDTHNGTERNHWEPLEAHNARKTRGYTLAAAPIRPQNHTHHILHFLHASSISTCSPLIPST